GKPQRDPGNPASRWISNVEHSRLRVDDCRRPALELVRFKTDPSGALDAEAQFLAGADQVEPDPDSARLSLDGAVQPGAFDVQARRFRYHATGLLRGKHVVRIEANDSA